MVQTYIYESTIAGTVFVEKIDRYGHVSQIKVGGEGARNRRIQLTEEEVARVHFLSPEDNIFTNGILRRVDGGAGEDQIAKTNEQLFGMLGKANTEDLLMEEPEINVRRLVELAVGDMQDRVSYSDVELLKRVVQERFAPPPEPEIQKFKSMDELAKWVTHQ